MLYVAVQLKCTRFCCLKGGLKVTIDTLFSIDECNRLFHTGYSFLPFQEQKVWSELCVAVTE